MAITLVQGNYNEIFTSASLAIGYTSPTTVGNFLVVLLGWQDAVDVTSVVDDAGNTYTRATGAYARATDGGWNQSTDIYYCENSAGIANTVTITMTGSAGAINAAIQEYSGVKASGSLDTTVPATGGGNVIGGSITPSLAGEILFCVAGEGQYVLSGTVDSPWTQIQNSTNDGFGTAGYINPPLSATACHFNPTGATSPFDFASSTASFKPVASGPSAKQKASMFLVF